MAEDAAEERAERYAETIANALRRHAGNVIYPDYEPKNDFTLWLSGYKEKVRNAFGFSQNEKDELENEVVRSISGKLSSGSALDAYSRLPDADKTDYARLAEALTREFIDPQERRRFIENQTYNKRRKGQSLKAFMQEILKDQNRYSGMRDTIQVEGAEVPNIEKVRDGVRRFKNGIRTRDGRKDKDQIRHLRYNLQEDDDLTWENALKVASRWEAANEQESSNEESSDDEPIGAIAAKKSKKRSSTDASLSLASLSLKVEANSNDIREMKENQKEFYSNLKSWQEETQSTLNAILAAIQGPAEQDSD